MQKKKILTELILVLLLISATSSLQIVQAVEPSLKIAVSIQPQIEWLEEVGGSHVDILGLIPKGQSPHTYSPTTTELTFIAEADIWFQIGLIEFDLAHEQAFIDAGKESLTVVNLSIGLDLIYMSDHQHTEDEAQASLEDSTGEAYDPHTWSSLSRTIQMIQTIQATLVDLDPSHAAEYTSNAEAYISKLTNLNSTTASLLETVENRHLLIFHPTWGYFCHDFDLDMIALEEDGQDPSSKHYVEVLDAAKENEVGVIFIQAEISQAMAQSFSEDAGVEIVQLFPLAKNYLANMNSTAYLIAEKLDQPPQDVLNIPGFSSTSVLLAGLFGVLWVIWAARMQRRRN